MLVKGQGNSFFFFSVKKMFNASSMLPNSKCRISKSTVQYCIIALPDVEKIDTNI
jgi:hypothetical protein